MDGKLALRLMELSRRIAIVSPLRYIGMDGERKLSSIDTVSVPFPDRGKYLYVYEFTEGEDVFYEDHILLKKVLIDDLAAGRSALKLYRIMKSSPLHPISIKWLMRASGITDFYKVRALLDRFVETGLMIALPEESGGANLYIPYFYHGEEAEVILVRHLLSLGYSVSYEMRRCRVFHARRLDDHMVISYGTNDAQLSLIEFEEVGTRILVTPKDHIIHFKTLINLTLREFLGSICPGQKDVQ